MPAAVPVPPATPAEEWEFLEWNVLKPSRTGSVCTTCPIHQGLIPQGEPQVTTAPKSESEPSVELHESLPHGIPLRFSESRLVL